MSNRLLLNKIGKVGLKTSTRRDWVKVVMSSRESNFFIEMSGLDDKVAERRLDELSMELTLGDFVEALNIFCQDYESRNTCRRPFRLLKREKFELKRIGLTQLDFVGLANCPVSVDTLKKLSKKRLRQLPARILGTLSNHALLSLTLDLKKPQSQITIGDLDSLPRPKDWDYKRDKFPHRYGQRSILKTRAKISKLGFTIQDCLFLRFGTREEAILDLMASENLGRKMAGEIIEIAERQGWLKYPISD